MATVALAWCYGFVVFEGAVDFPVAGFGDVGSFEGFWGCGGEERGGEGGGDGGESGFVGEGFGGCWWFWFWFGCL